MATQKSKMVEIKLPRPAKGEEPTLFVGVNGKGYRIKKGETVIVPEEVAEVLRNANHADDELYQFIMDNADTNPGK